MFHITCTLPNAATEISGIEFELLHEEEGGADPVRTVRTIDPVDEETAKQFATIPGYTIEPADAESAPAKSKRGRPSKAELEARAAAEAAAAAPPPVAEAPAADEVPAAADQTADGDENPVEQPPAEGDAPAAEGEAAQ